jgi:hypothetical protein
MANEKWEVSKQNHEGDDGDSFKEIDDKIFPHNAGCCLKSRVLYLLEILVIT